MSFGGRRRIEESVFKVLMIGSTVIVVSSLLLILGTVVVKSLPALRLSMIFQTPKGGYYLGKEGGILNAILGSLYLAGGATLFAVVASLPVVLHLNLYARPSSPLSTITRFALDVLWGVPSIVYGAFGFMIMLALRSLTASAAPRAAASSRIEYIVREIIRSQLEYHFL